MSFRFMTICPIMFRFQFISSSSPKRAPPNLDGISRLCLWRGESSSSPHNCPGNFTIDSSSFGSHFRRPSLLPKVNEGCRVGFESQNQSFIQIEQLLDESITGITSVVAESTLLGNKNPKENALFVQLSGTLRS